MLSKLLKRDLKKNMRWMWILFVGTIVLAAVTRGAKELGENLAFFKVIHIIFEGAFYGLAVNLIIQPFLRNFLNFYKSFYSDESYLTHTLPVTKNQLINSKYLTAIIEICAGFLTLIISLLILFAGPGFMAALKLLVSTAVSGKFSIVLILILFVILVIIEFLMFISIINFSIVVAFKSKDRRILKAFLIATGCAFASLAVLTVCMFAVLAINGIELISPTLVIEADAMYSVFISAIVVYSAVTGLFYFLAKREFNKGVNVD